ncbi:MAG TPA: 30S ribosomal protein S8 [Patescibacteria group bacterium]|nr:30S ribosomal protein S8 [Patescibacteria group bacterium]
MYMTDPIADMLTRIRNALAVRKPEVVLPFSKMKFTLAKILVETGYIGKAEVLEKAASEKSFNEIKVTLKYLGSEPAIRNLKRISRPGRRVYAKTDKLPTVLNKLGIAIISTPRGIMTNKEARKKHLGGEVICEIY